MHNKRWLTVLLVTLAAVTQQAAIAGDATAASSYVLRGWKNVATGYCLDSNAAGDVYTRPCSSGVNNFQRWKVSLTGAVEDYRFFELQNYATGLCLESNVWNAVYTHACTRGNNQTWVSGKLDHGYIFTNNATNKVLDSNADRKVYTHDYNAGNFQQWISLNY
ncbi:ricin-type beta-trefoil lectin domain protein [Streptomyces sp. SP2-10]|uniref:RICIN domain-containing protein n=1 Tax=Streptomyces sp. SP2-10 TaxID=2873385 RepID=UPI001CA67D29|nr:ricin-type beta-trefoil lectin domain protein [Streptomyces sp. SP2-10]MBY8846227.1 RICIN domain-containing protein [Streptomyces sp. SP2-10]